MRLCSYPAKPGVNSDADTGEDWNSSVSQKQAVFFSLFFYACFSVGMKQMTLIWDVLGNISILNKACFMYFKFE